MNHEQLPIQDDENRSESSTTAYVPPPEMIERFKSLGKIELESDIAKSRAYAEGEMSSEARLRATAQLAALEAELKNREDVKKRAREIEVLSDCIKHWRNELQHVGNDEERISLETEIAKSVEELKKLKGSL